MRYVRTGKLFEEVEVVVPIQQPRLDLASFQPDARPADICPVPAPIELPDPDVWAGRR